MTQAQLQNLCEEAEDLRQALAERQLEVWPDSRILTVHDVYGWINSEPPHLEYAVSNWRGIPGNDNRLDHFDDFVSKVRAEYSLNVARSLMLCLQAPVGVFYECGKNADGTYKWRGFRYGFEESQYMSGFGRH